MKLPDKQTIVAVFRAHERFVAMVLTIAVVLVIGVGVGGYIYLSSDEGEEMIARLVRERLEGAIDGDVVLGSVETNVFSWIEVRNVRIAGQVDGAEVEFLSLSRGRVSYDLWDLAFMTFHIDGVKLDSLRVTVLRDSTGSFVLPLTPSEPSTGKKDSSGGGLFSVRLDELKLTDSSCRYYDRAISLDGELHDIDAGMMLRLDGGYSYKLSAGEGHIRYVDAPLPVVSINVTGMVKGRQIEVSEFKLESPKAITDGHVFVDMGGDNATLDGSVTFSGDPAPFAPLYRGLLPEMLTPVSGSLNVTVTFNGPVARPSVDADVAAKKLTMGKLNIAAMGFHAVYNGERLDIGSLTMQAINGAAEGTLGIRLKHPYDHTMSLSLSDVSINEMLALFADTTDYHGGISGSIETAGGLADPAGITGDIKLTAPFLLRGDNTLNKLRIEASSHDSVMTVNVTSSDTNVSGRLSIAGEDIDGSYTADTSDLDDVLAFFGVEGVSGPAHAEGQVMGTFGKPRMRVNLSGENVRYRTIPFDTIDGTLVYDDTFSFENASFESQLTYFTAPTDTLAPGDGEVTVVERPGVSVSDIFQPFSAVDAVNQGDRDENPSPPDSVSTSQNTPPAVADGGLFGVPGLQGDARITGTLSGPFSALTGTVTGTVDAPSYRGYNMKHGEFTVELADSLVAFRMVHVENDAHRLDMSGDFVIPARVFNLNAAVSDIGGDDGALGTITATVTLPDSSGMGLDAVGEDVNIGSLSRYLPLDMSLGGRFSFNVGLEGGMSRPHGRATVSLDSLAVDGIVFNTLRAECEASDSLITVSSLNGTFYDNEFEGWGVVEITRDASGISFSSDTRIHGAFDAPLLNLAVLKPLLPENISVGGQAGLSMEWNGTVHDPGLRGAITVSDASFGPDDGRDRVSGVDAMLYMDGLMVRVEKFNGEYRGKPLDISGQVVFARKYGEESNIRISYDGSEVVALSGAFRPAEPHLTVAANNLDLRLLEDYAPGINDLRGFVDGSVTFARKDGIPALDGMIIIDEVTFKPSTIDQRVNGGHMQLSVAGNTATLDSLYARLGGGYITGSGSMTWGDGKVTRADMTAHVRKVRIQRPRFYRLAVDRADLRAETRQDGVVITGMLDFGDTRYLRNVSIPSLVGRLTGDRGPDRGPSPILSSIGLNISIENSDRMWIENNLAKVRFNPDIDITGSAIHPSLAGRVSFTEGYVLYLDRKFNVSSGTFDFVGGEKINPLIDLTAESRVTSYASQDGEQYDVTLTVTGYADDPDIALTSDPALSQPDIVALLTIGATQQQLTGSGDNAQMRAMLQERLGAFSSQRLSHYVGRELGSLIGIEDIAIQGNLFSTDRSAGPQLLASEQLSDRLRVTYTTTVGKVNEHSVRLDYELNKFWSVQGETDQKGAAALDLKYKLRF